MRPGSPTWLALQELGEADIDKGLDIIARFQEMVDACGGDMPWGLDLRAIRDGWASTSKHADTPRALPVGWGPRGDPEREIRILSALKDHYTDFQVAHDPASTAHMTNRVSAVHRSSAKRPSLRPPSPSTMNTGARTPWADRLVTQKTHSKRGQAARPSSRVSPPSHVPSRQP